MNIGTGNLALRSLLLGLLLVLVSPRLLPAAPADEQARFLEVRRAQIELRMVRSEHDRTREMFEQGLVPRTELERSEAAVETAQLDYQKAVLSLLSLQPRVSVEKAIKLEARDGRKLVRLTVVNSTPVFDDSQLRLLENFEGAEPIPEALKTRDLGDVFVSLESTGEPVHAGDVPSARGTTIALPYEVHLPKLTYGRSKTLEFELLRDVPSVLVALSYKGQKRELDIQLQQAESARVVQVAAAQISQEADLGGQATYDLHLERSTVDSRRFQLGVLNLPRQVAYTFVDPASQARLSQINFPAGVTRQDLLLRLFLPERPDEAVAIDRPLEFWVVVTSPSEATTFASARTYTAEQVERSRAGAARLEVVPCGVGRIEVSAPSLYAQIVSGEAAETRIRVTNTGTRRLDNVELTAEAPLDWRTEIRPAVVPTLGIREEREIVLRVMPPAECPVGDYEVRIKTESRAYDRKVPSEEKIFRVSVKAKRNVVGVGLLVSSLLLLVGGIVTVGVRVTRR